MNNELNDLREEIDAIDDKIVDLLSKRMSIVEKVGKLKKEHQIPPLDKKRLAEVLDTKKNKAKIVGVSESFIEKLFKVIHDHSVKLQKKV
jgi:chorismate mutase